MLNGVYFFIVMKFYLMIIIYRMLFEESKEQSESHASVVIHKI